MAIRPYILIAQDLKASAPNILESKMKGMLVGPSVQDESNFTENVDLSATYGTIASVLTEASVSAKTMNIAGLIPGARVIFESLKFGAKDAKAKIDFNADPYKGTVSDLAQKHLIVLDTTAGNVGKEQLLEKGAEKGDEITISFDDGSGTIVKETHKVRDYIVDQATGAVTIKLWDFISNAGLTTTTEILIEHYKRFGEAELNILSPMTAGQYSNSFSVFSLDNTSNSVDGGFSTDYYVYSPIGSQDGVTFENRLVSTVKISNSGYTEQKVSVRVMDGKLMNFFSANRADLSNNVFEVSTSNYIQKLGSPTMKNKLSYAMSIIEKEIPGATMKVYVTEDDSSASYSKAFNALTSQENVYSITPLTDRNDILGSMVGMVKAAASDSVAKYKMGVIGPRTSYYVNKITSNDFAIAQIVGDTFKLTIPNGGLLAQGVEVGDFIFDDSGIKNAEDTYYTVANETYSENAVAVVESITTDTEAVLRVVTPGTVLTDAFATGGIEIGSISKNSNLIDILKQRAEDISHKNMVALFPDKYEMTLGEVDTIVPGFYVAGLVNAVIAHLPPQQGISNLSLNSVNKIYGSSFYFSDSELDEIASAGNLVVLQRNYTSSPYMLRQLTTNTASLETMEINKVRCLDYATLAFSKVLDDFIGKRNINNSNLREIERKLESVGKTLVSSTANDLLGSIITSFTVSDVIIPEGEIDAVNAYVDVTTPTSMNKIRLFVRSGSTN